MKKTRKWILLSVAFTIMLLSPFISDACSGAYYACGDEVTIEAMIDDANQNCPSGSTFAIFHCDGGAFWVNVQ